MPDVLPSATQHTAAQLAEEGSHFAFARLADGADERLLLLVTDVSVLGKWGFTATWSDALKAKVAALRTHQGARDTTAADHATTVALASTFHDLAEWVKDYQTATELGDAATAAAPHPKRGWNTPAHIKESLPGLLKFAAEHAFDVEGGTSAAFAQKGQAALDAFTAAQSAHTLHDDTQSPDAAAFRAEKGLIAFELARLAKVAKRRLPAARAAKYALYGLRGH